MYVIVCMYMITPKTIEVHGYTVRKFNIKEFADLSKRFKAVMPVLTSLNGKNEEEQTNDIISLITTSLPELIIAVSYATEKPIEEIEKIDDMQVFGDLVVAIKEVNDFLALQTALTGTLQKLFQSQQKN